jgi:PadR family transcriptional regulator
MDRAELRSGTIYPLLHRLQAEGWLGSAREEIDPSEEGRPRRRLYWLTGVGQSEAQKVLAAHGRSETRLTAAKPVFHPGGAFP